MNQNNVFWGFLKADGVKRCLDPKKKKVTQHKWWFWGELSLFTHTHTLFSSHSTHSFLLLICRQNPDAPINLFFLLLSLYRSLFSCLCRLIWAIWRSTNRLSGKSFLILLPQLIHVSFLPSLFQRLLPVSITMTQRAVSRQRPSHKPAAGRKNAYENTANTHTQPRTDGAWKSASSSLQLKWNQSKCQL